MQETIHQPAVLDVNFGFGQLRHHEIHAPGTVRVMPR